MQVRSYILSYCLENNLKWGDQMRLKDVLTQEEKEMIEEYRKLMFTTWSKWKSDRYFKAIMDILDEAEKRYYENRHKKESTRK